MLTGQGPHLTLRKFGRVRETRLGIISNVILFVSNVKVLLQHTKWKTVVLSIISQHGATVIRKVIVQRKSERQ